MQQEGQQEEQQEEQREGLQGKVTSGDSKKILNIKKYDVTNEAELIRLMQEDDSVKSRVIKEFVESEIKKAKLTLGCSSFDFVFLYDIDRSISRWHAAKIYAELHRLDESQNDVILILRSCGGAAEPAYLISKMFRRCLKGDSKFIVSVPAEAKSAATLLSLGADEIHMGPMSELGPIDPLVNNVPLLSITNGLETIVSLAHKYPEACNMLSSFLEKTLDIKKLGYSARIAESSTQYALRLIKSKMRHTVKHDGADEAERLAEHFTNHYKDHSFVIDVDEAKELLGPNVVCENTEIYKIGHRVHLVFDLVSQLSKINGKQFSFVGCECFFDGVGG